MARRGRPSPIATEQILSTRTYWAGCGFGWRGLQNPPIGKMKPAGQTACFNGRLYFENDARFWTEPSGVESSKAAGPGGAPLVPEEVVER